MADEPRLTLPAPAKLNLFLHITGRRPDGYHSLQSVFQFLDMGDDIQVTLRRDGRILRVSEVPGVSETEDLTLRAAHLLQQHGGVDLGVELRVQKRLPMGGGLGGGSSDAATTLAALNRLWGLALPEDELARLGLSLGADVPVFIRGRAAWAEGVGERLTPVNLEEPCYLVIMPPCHVSTAEVFSAPELTRDTPARKIPSLLLGTGAAMAVERLMEVTGNDCEALVRGLHVPVDEVLTWLANYGRPRMTGTGACVFAPFANEATARRVLGKLPNRWRGFLATGRNVSPLKAALER